MVTNTHNPITDEALRRDNRIEPYAYAPVRNGELCCIVPSRNYGRYIEQTLDSILAQTRPADQIIVIDDGSTDDTLERIKPYRGRGVQIVQNPRNLGLAATRNRAIAMTDAEFVVSVDADDWILPRYFEACLNALQADESLGVVYTSVSTWSEPEQRMYSRPNLWPAPFNWDWTAVRAFPPRTMIPAGAMYRREMWRRCGGFMESYTRAEDAEFWLRGLSVGFDVRKVDNTELYVWRLHGNNMSKTDPDVDVLAWLPWLWRGDAPSGAPTAKAVTRDYTNPTVSVIVTIGPGHGQYAASALESVIGQTFWNWELVIVNDSGEDIDFSRYPFAKVIEHTEGGTGASAARNIGLEVAAAPYVLFLDGDDFLHPFALQRLAETYVRVGHGFVYPELFEFVGQGREGTATARQLSDWRPDDLRMHCGITTLMRREDAQAVGFDESMRDGWEDVDFYLRLRLAGVCGTRLAEPLFYYRVTSGSLRNRAGEKKAELEALIDERYGAYRRGEKQMSCCGGPVGEQVIELKNSLRGLPTLPTVPTVAGMVRMQFIGQARGEVTYFGKYTAANNDTSRFVNALPDDVQRLENTGLFVKAQSASPAEPAAFPIVATEPPVDPYAGEADAGMPAVGIASAWTDAPSPEGVITTAVVDVSGNPDVPKRARGGRRA